MKYKPYAVLLLSLSILTPAVMAHDNKTSTHHKMHQNHRVAFSVVMADALNLTNFQKTEIRKIEDQYKPKLKKLKIARKASLFKLDPASKNYYKKLEHMADERAKKARQMVILRGKMHAEIYAVLKPGQQQKLKSLKNEMKDHRQS